MFKKEETDVLSCVQLIATYPLLATNQIFDHVASKYHDFILISSFTITSTFYDLWPTLLLGMPFYRLRQY